MTSAQRHLLTGRFVQLPHAKVPCAKCKLSDAVYFQSQQRTAETGMVSYLKCRYGEGIGSHFAGHFLRVLQLSACLVHASGLQAQVLDPGSSFEGGFQCSYNMMSMSSMGLA